MFVKVHIQEIAWYDSTVNTDITIFGAILIYTFPLMIGIGIGVGLLWAVWPVSIFPDIAQARMESGSIALGGAVVGGRVGYVLVNWMYFQKNIAETIQIWSGGFSWTGSVAGALLAILITARVRKTSFGDLVDGLRPLLTSTAVSAWLASWMTGYAYGLEVDAWWGIPARNEWGFVAQRWPIQLVGTFSALGFHWLSDQLQARKWGKIPGLAASLELGGLFVTILALSPHRGDPAPQWGGIRVDSWVSIFFIVLCSLMAFTLTLRTDKIRKTTLQPSDHEN